MLRPYPAGSPSQSPTALARFFGKRSFPTQLLLILCAFLAFHAQAFARTPAASTQFSQTIFFPVLPTAYAGISVTLNATASSGLPITYSVLSGPGTVSGTTLSYFGPGTVTLQADQPGNSTYAAAPSVQQTSAATLLTQPLQTTSPVISTLVTFTADGGVSSIYALTNGAVGLDFALVPGGTCRVGTTYTVGQTCTLLFTFTPTNAGQRNGGLTITSFTGALIANAYVYGIGVGPQLVFSPATQTSLPSDALEPSGVAVDANGNVFVSDIGGNGLVEILPNGTTRAIGNFLNGDDVAIDGSGNVFIGYNRSSVAEVLAVNGVIPVSPTIRVISTAFDGLNGLKIDGNGNIFLANGSSTPGNSTIHEILAVNGVIPASPTIVLLSTYFPTPTGVAVDANGDVFVSDQTLPGAFEIQAVNGVIPASPTIRSLGSGFASPSNIVLDDNGNVYVTDFGNHVVEELLAINGVVPASPTILTVGSGLATPQGIFVDSLGDLFIADSSLTGIVKLAYGAPPTLTFADTNVGSTSIDSPHSVTFLNTGNAALTYSSPLTGTNPAITSGYTLDPTSTCPKVAAGAAAATLASGTSCTDAVDFTPVTAGPDPGMLVTADNNLGMPGATQIVLLHGNGLGVAPTIVFTVPNHIYDDPPFAVAATSNSAGAFTYTVVSGPATLSGNIVTLTGTGTVTLLASQAAAGIYTAGSATATFLVTKKPQTLQFAPLASPIPYSATPIPLIATATSGLPVTFSVLSGPGKISGSSLIPTGAGTIIVAADQPGDADYDPAPEVTQTLIVTAAAVGITLTGGPSPVFLNNPVTLTATVSASPLIPTGTVTFLEGTTPVGSAVLTANGAATLSITTLALGTHVLVATYSGDNNFLGGTSNTVTIIVQDFTFAVTTPNITIFHGGTATYAIQVNSVGGTGTPAAITLTIAGAPDQSTITFSPQAVPLNTGTQTISLVIKTPNYPVGPFTSLTSNAPTTLTLFFAGLLLLPFRRRVQRLGMFLLLCAALTTLSGCGSGWRTQVWPMQLSATSGGLTHTVPLTLTSVCKDGEARCPVVPVN